MTTVAFKDGILAADSQVTVGGTIKLTSDPKIKILTPDTILGAAGSVEAIAYLQRFFTDPEWETKLNDKVAKKYAKQAEAFLWHKGTMYILEHHLVPVPLAHPFYAVGSGWTMALSAMKMGMSAEDSVKFASEFDIHTNDKVQVVNVTQLEGQGPTSPKGRKKPRVPPSAAGD